MESFKDMLLVGGKTNSLGRAGEVLEIVRSDTSRLDELFECIYHDDAWVRLRAIDTFEKLVKENPGLVTPYLERIFNDLTKSRQPSIQWHLAQIFSEVELTDAQRNTAIAWLKDKIKTTNVDWIVSGDVMKALLYFHAGGFVETKELIDLFKVQEGHKSKAISKKATKLLHNLSA